MLVIAISIKGQEYLYRPATARRVSQSSADYVCRVANENKYLLKNDNETWYIHNVDNYDAAAVYASRQAFTVRAGIVSDRRN